MAVERAVELVQEKALIRPHRLYSSDLPRCAELARSLAKVWCCPVDVTPQIREMNFGDWEGRTYDELYTKDGDRWQRWCENWQTQAPPNGESLEQFTQRVKDWLSEQSFTEPTLIVTHAGVLRVLQVLSGEDWDQAMETTHSYLEWQRFVLTEL